MTTEIILTTDQQNALEAFDQFIIDPVEMVFVLSGYSGTGKSTLVSTLLDRLPNVLRAAKLINAQLQDFTIQLTATTNKAAENFAHITGQDVSTIHSFLGLRVNTNYSTGETQLSPKNADIQENYILFIDEASYIDKTLLHLIFAKVRNCKVIFIGDPAQLTQVKATTTPVFDAKFPGAHLSQVVRQAEGNPITGLATKFRHTVNTGEFFSFTPDGQSVVHLSRYDFNRALLAEFARPDWRYQNSKFLAWTNKRVIEYNQMVRDNVKGDPHFQVGDYAVCNSFVVNGKTTIKTDQMVHITGISEPTEVHGVKGKQYTLDHSTAFFGPDSLQDWNEALKKARATDQYHAAQEMTDRWIDLRAAYACTINKSQGSTYDRVFIDLDDIKRCNSGNQIARMLYVAVSRARQQVYMTGDLV